MQRHGQQYQQLDHLDGRSLAANGSCTVDASITGTIGDFYNNTSGAVTSKEGGTGNPSNTAQLTVVEPPVIGKAFGQPNNGISTLTFTLTNPSDNVVSLQGVGFTDALPTGMTVADAPTTSQCNGTVTALVGAGTITFTDGSIDPVSYSSGTCTVSVDVSALGGSYVNTSGPVTSTNGGTGNKAVASLTMPGAGLLLTKSTTNAGFQSGGTITYNYVLTNTGDEPLYGNDPTTNEFTITDSKIGTFTCGTVTSLAAAPGPGNSVNCSKTYNVGSGDVSAGFVTNTATGTGQDQLTGGNTVTSNQSTVTVQLEGLTLQKSSPTPGYQKSGDKITYHYTVTNTGNVTLYPPFSISDALIQSGPFNCVASPPASLAPEANIICASQTYLVTGTDVTNGSVTNTATADAKDAAGVAVTSNNSSATVYEANPPTIAKAFSPTQITVGSTSTLTFTITNPNTNSSDVLTGIQFSDAFPSGMTVANTPLSSQCGGSINASAGDISISFSGGSVLANSTCTVSVAVTAGAGGTYQNTSDAVSSTNGGPGTPSNTATLTVIAPPTISKAFSPTSILVNGISTLTFTLTNPSRNTIPLTGVGFTDNFPTGIQAASSPNMTSSCGGSASLGGGGTSLTISGGTIAVSGTCTITIDVTATSAGTFNNTTTAVTSNEGGTGAPSNTATLVSNEAADLSITKTDGKVDVNRGELLTYMIVVHNAGPSDVTGATVLDTIPSSLTNVTWACSLGAPSCTASGSGNINDTVNIPAGGSITYMVNATVSNSAASDVINSATVIPPSGVTDSDLTNNSATDIDHLNLLSITKTPTPSSYSTVGTIINYSYTITNIGTSTLTSSSLSVSDNKLSHLTCGIVPSPFAPSDSFTCTASYTTTQADLDNGYGSISNSVTAKGKDAENDDVTSNTPTATVTATQNEILALDKTITSAGPYDSVGNEIDYSYTLTNTGNVTLTGNGAGGLFTITDNKIGTFTCGSATSLAPNGVGTVTCTSSYTITQTDLDNGSVTNQATGHGLFNTNAVDSTPVSQIATMVQNKSLKLAKSITSITSGGIPEALFKAAGDIVNYSYLLTNTGNVTLAGNGTGGVFTVNDNEATVTCPASPTTLAPGATVTCTASHTVTQAEMDSGIATNLATAHDITLVGSHRVTSNTDTQTANGIRTPGLTLAKSITSGSPFTAAGKIVSYSYLLTNTGNVTLTGIGGGVFTVSDSLVTVACPSTPTSLAPAATITCTANYIVTQADVDHGSVTNTATAHSITKVGSTSVDSNTDTKIATATQTPKLTVAKSITSGNPYSKAGGGDTIAYSYLLTNSGNVTLIGNGVGNVFTVTDDKTTVICPASPTSLAPGATVTCTATYTTTQADVDNGSVTNHATAHSITLVGSTPVDSNTDSKTATSTQNKSLTLVKSIISITMAGPYGPAYNSVNDVITYGYTLTNTGNVTLTGADLATNYFTITDDHIGTPLNTAFTCGIKKTLVPGDSVTCTNTYAVTQIDLDNGSVTNQATGHGLFNTNAVDSTQVSQTAKLQQNPALNLVKSITSITSGGISESTFKAAGDVVNYSYLLTNTGNVTLTSISVGDDKATVTCPPGSLAPQATTSCTASYTITQTDVDNGSVTNLATGHAITLVGSTAVNSLPESQTANGTRTPGLTLAKSITSITSGGISESTFKAAGDIVNYSYLLTNTGNVTLTGIGGGVFTVSDDQAVVACPASPTSLAPGDTVTCTANYTVTQADVDNGSVTNTATAHSITKVGSAAVDSLPESQTATATQNKSLTLAKSITSGNPYSKAGGGDIIAYSYLLTNSGNVTLIGNGAGGLFTVTDDHIGTPVNTPFTCGAATSLAPGGTVSCTSSYTTTQADIDNGSVTNTATAHSITKVGSAAVDSLPESKTATATQNKSLTLVKSITSIATNGTYSPYNSVGDLITYSYTLTNTGNVTLTGADLATNYFTITDDHIGTPLNTAFTCGIQKTLVPGDSITCTNIYAVTQDDINNGSVTNQATGHGLFHASAVDSTQVSQTATLKQNRGLTLVKSITSGNPYSAVGDQIKYSYTLTNTGNVTLTGADSSGKFTITDDHIKAGSPPAYNDPFTCDSTPAITSLAPAASVTCAATYAVQAGDLGSSVTNTATGHAITLVGSKTVDLNQASQTAYGAPILNITKDDGVQIVAPGATVTYTINVTNASLQDSTGLQLVDTIPAGTSFISADGGGTYNSTLNQVTWPSFDLAKGVPPAYHSATFHVTLQVDDISKLGAIASLTNTVHIQDDGTHSPNGTPVQAQATDTDAIAMNGVKNLTGTEQAGSTGDNVLIGEIIDYAINIDLPTGTIKDLKAVDTLDHGLAFVDCGFPPPSPAQPVSTTSTQLTITQDPCTAVGSTDSSGVPGGGLTVAPAPSTGVDAGRDITFDFGQVQNTSATTQTLTVNYRVIVLNIADNVNGVGLKNGVEWTWEGGILAAGQAVPVNIIEPKLTIVKTVDPAVANLGIVVGFKIDIAHDLLHSTAPAYDVLMTDAIPTGLQLDQTTVVVNNSANLPTAVVTTTPTQVSVYWSSFPLGEKAEVSFQAKFIGPSPVVNAAGVEWSSIQIDPAPHLVPQSPYNNFSTERRYDPLTKSLNDYTASAAAQLIVPSIPSTGFAPGKVTHLPVQPADKTYQDLGDFWVEIPRLNIKVPIIGIPFSNGDWDLTWLGDQAGYLDGTAYPTHVGNSVITAHVYTSNGLPGPFVNLSTLKWGDQIIIHFAGQQYIYEVRENKVILPSDKSVFKHEDQAWITLITCKDYNVGTNSYTYRIEVGAMLVKVEPDTSSNSGGK